MSEVVPVKQVVPLPTDGKSSAATPGHEGEPAEPALVDRGPPPGVPPRALTVAPVDATEAAAQLEARRAELC